MYSSIVSIFVTEILGTYHKKDIYLFNNDCSDETDFCKSYTGHRNSDTNKGVNFYGPASEYVVSGSDCGNVFLWDKESAQIVQIQHGEHPLLSAILHLRF